MVKSVLLCAAMVLLPPGMTVFAIGGGDITFELKNADPVRFSHDFHLKIRGLKCSACHFARFAKGASYAMKKESITKRDFCGHCHNGLKGFSTDNEKNCTRCHSK